MNFNSYIFILLFLPLSLIGYYSFNKMRSYKLAQVFLVTMSFWFYGYFNIHYLMILISSILFNYLVYRILASYTNYQSKLIIRGVLAFGIICNLGILFYFKYFGFFVTNMNAAFHSNFTLHNILLPLGISFFTFQQIAFLVDIYRQKSVNCSLAKVNDTLLEYTLFVSFFPHLVSGPIVTNRETIPQFQDIKRKNFSLENFTKGLMAFSYGLGKKVIVADTIGIAVDWGYENIGSLNTTSALILVTSFALQLYFDFSGYSDMARGIGKMFNIDLPMNFHSPYKATNLIDFWKRWHITLNRFFTKYVYIPLGGNRHGMIRTYLNLFIIFLLSGLWHGALWTFVIWGAIHGIFYVLTKIGMPIIKKIPSFITCLFTNVIWIFSLIYFRAASLTQAHQVIAKFLPGNIHFGKISVEMAEGFHLDEFFYLFKMFGFDSNNTIYTLSMYGFLMVVWFMIFFCKNVNEKLESKKMSLRSAFACSILLLWSIVSFSEVSSFLYVNF